MSGLTCRPWNSSSSATFTMAVTPLGSTASTSPETKRAAPTPPQRTAIRRICVRLCGMSDRLPRPRADLETFPAYRTQQVSADVRVNANEWPEPNPAGLYLSPSELDDILLNRYPSAAATADLRQTLAARYGVKPEQLIFGNGSNDVLLNVFLVFGGHGRSTLLFQPTYSMHTRPAQIAGGTVVDEDIGLPYDL